LERGAPEVNLLTVLAFNLFYPYGLQKNQYYIGRQGNLLYYQWRDIYCVRTKGALGRQRFYSDKAFAGSRKRAEEFGIAAKLAAEVYQLLPKELKKRGVMGKLTGWAHKGLMAGESKDAVRVELLEACGLTVPGKAPIEACTCRYIQMEPAQRYGGNLFALQEERLYTAPSRECPITFLDG
jgi:hypothetical protein